MSELEKCPSPFHPLQSCIVLNDSEIVRIRPGVLPSEAVRYAVMHLGLSESG